MAGEEREAVPLCKPLHTHHSLVSFCLFVCLLSFVYLPLHRVALWTSSCLPLFAWWQWQQSRQSRRSGTLEERRGGGGAQSVEGAGGL